MVLVLAGVEAGEPPVSTGITIWSGILTLLAAWKDAQAVERAGELNPQRRALVPFMLLTPIGYFIRRRHVAGLSLTPLWVWLMCAVSLPRHRNRPCSLEAVDEKGSATSFDKGDHMKIAAGIIGLIMGLLVLLQSCAVATTASIAEIETGAQEGSVGVLAAFIYLDSRGLRLRPAGCRGRTVLYRRRLGAAGLDHVSRPRLLGRRGLAFGGMTGWASLLARRQRKAAQP